MRTHVTFFSPIVCFTSETTCQKKVIKRAKLCKWEREALSRPRASSLLAKKAFLEQAE